VIAPEEAGRSGAKLKDDALSEIFHELSQPLTTLECGLELALRHDTTVAQLRKRLNVLLETAFAMHQKLAGLRGLRQERDAGSCDDDSETTERSIPNDF
jgi:signal transduction histidine kinase